MNQDPLIDAFLGHRPPAKRTGIGRGATSADAVAIVPNMSFGEESACLHEIKQRPLAHWAVLANGMTAGTFAWIYVHHYGERRNHRGVNFNTLLKEIPPPDDTTSSGGGVVRK